MFIAELGVVDGVSKGMIDFTAQMPKFATYGDVVNTFENTTKSMMQKVKGISEADYDSTMPFAVGPNQMGQLRKADVLWTMLMDQIHHCGQFSVYLRLVGAKVPSIYGPSGDEPWM